MLQREVGLTLGRPESHLHRETLLVCCSVGHGHWVGRSRSHFQPKSQVSGHPWLLWSNDYGHRGRLWFKKRFYEQRDLNSITAARIVTDSKIPTIQSIDHIFTQYLRHYLLIKPKWTVSLRYFEKHVEHAITFGIFRFSVIVLRCCTLLLCDSLAWTVGVDLMEHPECVSIHNGFGRNGFSIRIPVEVGCVHA